MLKFWINWYLYLFIYLFIFIFYKRIIDKKGKLQKQTERVSSPQAVEEKKDGKEEMGMLPE
jgi:hypothetical protein